MTNETLMPVLTMNVFPQEVTLMKNGLVVSALLPSLIIMLALSACGGGGSSSSSDPTATAVSVGKEIFFDTSLSSDSNQSCSSCHDPASGFADPDVTMSAPVSEGSVAGSFGNRNAPTAAYASFIPVFTQFTSTTDDGTTSNYQGGQFLDGRRSDLIEQAKDPFLNPVEMNNVDAADVVNKVAMASYATEFKQVFGDDIFSDVNNAYEKIATAIAAFEASDEMNPFSSKFDAVMANQATFTASEQRGFDLFKGDVAKCANCHTVDDPADGSLFTDFRYFNIGTPTNPSNPSTSVDEGLGDSNRDPVVTDQAVQKGKFRTPTLRNVELTAPYMHNGSYDTLEDVIRHYDIQVTNGFITPEVGDNIAEELNPGTFTALGLLPEDYTDLENFMLTLTDGFM